ncbi:right-handed parallel beta-helix repeat-containing protein [Sphingobium sp.]|jgi:hypothetical protein|uniref:right-handed parallel beta-helix repeat-containing protein n=1 Tax=Sphingobium sp. TaxID=1912891 RepID=UPI00257A4941|nr:right-handed parallel beta-helix repeat-containing protein [Sphingobium sp.]
MTKAIMFSIIATAIGMLSGPSGLSSANTCQSMDLVKNKELDATPVIAECLANLKYTNILNLSPGIYQLLTPLVINKAVTIETTLASGGKNCSKNTGANCAVLAIGQMPPSTPNIMPIEVTAKNVHLRSMAVIGAGKRNVSWEQRICLDQHARPLGGGIRVKADQFQMTDVLLKNFSCYTALEIGKDVKGARLSGNVIGPNGNHMIRNMWSDGVTIHDSIGAVIKNNVFTNNTDVQLIFGGCVSCKIEGNVFNHSNLFSQASFAELMLHAWPGTSGNFTGSVISGNNIDCGTNRSCGYGIMIGGEPWYPSKAFGGTVKGNHVSNALMAINIDELTGPMNIQDNSVARSGGIANSDCGIKNWPDFNISESSIKFIIKKPKYYSSINTKKCLLGRIDNKKGD